MAKNIAERSTKNLFVLLFILNLKIKIIDKLGFISKMNIKSQNFTRKFFYKICINE